VTDAAPQLYLEDLVVGEVERFGRCVVEREEVIAFALRYDPQPYHVDDAAAAANPMFGRISASAVHTFAMTSRMLAERAAFTGFRPSAGLGMKEMRNLKPVYPGDVLTVETEITEARRSRSQPGRGVVTQAVRVYNQDGDKVMEFNGAMLFPARGP
jgi:acyl dehydratase